jgi:hypothetical protein
MEFKIGDLVATDFWQGEETIRLGMITQSDGQERGPSWKVEWFGSDEPDWFLGYHVSALRQKYLWFKERNEL